MSTTRKKSGLIYWNAALYIFDPLQITNGLIQFFKVELACVEVGTDRGQDNAKGIAETILKQVCLAQNLLYFLQKNNKNVPGKDTFDGWIHWFFLFWKMAR